MVQLSNTNYIENLSLLKEVTNTSFTLFSKVITITLTGIYPTIK
jgi:hypothetical protein